MNAFERAVATLHRDPHLSTACSWAPGWARTWPRTMVLDLQAATVTLSVAPVALRCVDDHPRAPAHAFEGPAILTDSRRVSIPIGDLPAEPDRGDQLDVGTAPYTIDAAPERDVEGLTWFITLAESD